MRSLKRLSLVILILALMVLILFFFLENRQSVSVALFSWATPAMPVALLMLISLCTGLIVSPLLSALAILRRKRAGRASGSE